MCPGTLRLGSLPAVQLVDEFLQLRATVLGEGPRVRRVGLLRDQFRIVEDISDIKYQDFHIDEPAMADLYGALERGGLIVLFHAGFDIGFPDSDRSSPARIDQVRESFPALSIVASHLGGFRQWEEAGRHLVGKDIYFDTSYTVGHIDPGLMREILRSHPPERLLFGSDSPWTDQGESVDEIRALNLGDDLEKRILSSNAGELLGLS